jgi:hypothetical protein
MFPFVFGLGDPMKEVTEMVITIMLRRLMVGLPPILILYQELQLLLEIMLRVQMELSLTVLSLRALKVNPKIQNLCMDQLAPILTMVWISNMYLIIIFKNIFTIFKLVKMDLQKFIKKIINQKQIPTPFPFPEPPFPEPPIPPIPEPQPPMVQRQIKNYFS